MFPPETMQHRPDRRRRARRARRRPAGRRALARRSVPARPGGARPQRRPRARSRRRPRREWRACSHISGSKAPEPAPSMNDGVYSTRPARAVRDRGRDRRSRLGLADVDLRLGRERVRGARDPGRQPAAAPRDEDGVEVVEVLDELEPDRPVARHDAVVLTGWTKSPRRPPCHRPPVRGHHSSQRRARSARPVARRRPASRRRVVGHDDRRRHAELACHPRDALRHVPGARRDEAGRERLRRRAQHRRSPLRGA